MYEARESVIMDVEVTFMYKERIANLMMAAKDEPDDMEFIESRMKTFTDYVAHVNWMETRIQRLTIEGVDGQEWRDQVQNLDSMRRSKHNVAMDAITQLNRMSQIYGVAPFYEGTVDHEHRTNVGDVIGDIVNEYFKERDVRQLTKEDLVADKFADAVASISENSAAVER